MKAQNEARANAERMRRWREEQERRKAEEAKKEEKPVELPKIEIEPEEKPAMQWVNFRCLLDVQKARALKAFFEQNNIEYRRV